MASGPFPSAVASLPSKLRYCSTCLYIVKVVCYTIFFSGEKKSTMVQKATGPRLLCDSLLRPAGLEPTTSPSLVEHANHTRLSRHPCSLYCTENNTGVLEKRKPHDAAEV